MTTNPSNVNASSANQAQKLDKIRLVLSDVDGTLVTSEKVLTPRAIAAVAALRERGIEFALTSGRPPRGMAMLIKPLALTTPFGAFNGGALTLPDMTVIEQHLLSEKAARTAVTSLLAQGLDVWVYTSTQWQVRNLQADRVDREAKTIGFGPTVVADFSDETFQQTIKVVGVNNDYPKVEKAESEIGRMLGRDASVSRSQPYYLDITHPLANKGAVLQALSQRLKIEPASIATIGDMPNDVLMFKQSGFSIAMGNASAAVQRCANAVTASFEEEGFAKAIEQFFLR